MFIDPDNSREDLVSEHPFRTPTKGRGFGSNQDLVADGGDASPAAGLSVRKLASAKGRTDQVFYSFPNTPARSQANLPFVSSDDSLTRSEDDQLLISNRRRNRENDDPNELALALACPEDEAPREEVAAHNK